VLTSHGPAYRRAKWGRVAKRLVRCCEAVGLASADVLTAVSAPQVGYHASRAGRCGQPNSCVRHIPNAAERTDRFACLAGGPPSLSFSLLHVEQQAERGETAERLREHCLAVMERMQPDRLRSARFSALDDTLWIQFGDGLPRAVKWSALPFAARLDLKPVSASVRGARPQPGAGGSAHLHASITALKSRTSALSFQC
jgi:hypothetical protein